MSLTRSCSSNGLSAPAVNVGERERQLSILVGTAVLGGLLLSRTRMFLTAAIGAGLIYRGMTGHCQAYDAMGVSTACPSGSAAEGPAPEMAAAI